ncbi:phage terminase small subunit P27 family [Mesorhizobium mediterraneum]|uniref:Phage terminase small subunit P27 family n=1 Tax=Mesorhizobium mediterraneum TaxID=43617 RepID=A0AB36R0B3_9HYPH|nr:phage terminase small subunit P27 family [Mesorhizobium mediterraneum]PAP97817.1 hypothetical protein CIT25_35105 [Mesorhizobium mediterraneum]WIW52048.1 phage terminase small subunit P27 family [Mesorhizobium mediterraneum]
MTRGPVRVRRVVAAQKAPQTPAWVPAIAVDVYQRVTSDLSTKGLLNDGNRDLVEIYVGTVAAIRRLNAAIEKDGTTLREKGKALRVHPAFAMLTEKEKQARMLAGRLGLIEDTRAAQRKAGTDVSTSDDEEEFDDL